VGYNPVRGEISLEPFDGTAMFAKGIARGRFLGILASLAFFFDFFFEKKSETKSSFPVIKSK
jgi:hypothetical protein